MERPLRPCCCGTLVAYLFSLENEAESLSESLSEQDRQSVKRNQPAESLTQFREGYTLHTKVGSEVFRNLVSVSSFGRRQDGGQASGAVEPRHYFLLNRIDIKCSLFRPDEAVFAANEVSSQSCGASPGGGWQRPRINIRDRITDSHFGPPISPKGQPKRYISKGYSTCHKHK